MEAFRRAGRKSAKNSEIALLTKMRWVMRKLMAISLFGVFAFFGLSSSVKADDDNFLENVSALINKAQDRVEDFIERVKAQINSPAFQAKLEQIRAEHRAKLKEVLLAVYPKIKKFREEVAPIIEARIQMKFMELHALMVDKLKIFKAQAAAAYEAELDKLISKLPDEVQDKVREIRASADYQKKRAEAAKKIEDYIVANIHKASNKFAEDLKAFVEEKLDELDAKILAKIESL